MNLHVPKQGPASVGVGVYHVSMPGAVCMRDTWKQAHGSLLLSTFQLAATPSTAVSRAGHAAQQER